MTAFAAALGREIRLAIREPGEAATAVMFFVLAALLFPFGVGPEPDLLARIAAGVLWVAALLAAMLSLERLFLGDYEDGSFEVLALCPLALPLVVGAKMLAHWLTTCIPLVAASPLLALLLDLGGGGSVALVAAMALGTPTVSLIGGVGAALTLGARRGGGAAVDPGAAVADPGADLRRRRGRRGDRGPSRPPASDGAGRDGARRRRAVPLGVGVGGPPGAGMTALSALIGITISVGSFSRG